MGATYERYAEIRDSKGFTDYYVAKETGIGKSTFTDWKKGRSTPKGDKLAKIAKVLDVPVDQLINEDGGQVLYFKADDLALLSMYKELNEIGRRKVMEYMSDIFDRYRHV